MQKVNPFQFKKGDFVYFKTARKGLSKEWPSGQFPGHGYGVYLGHVSLGKTELELTEFAKKLGEIGLFSLEDLGSFLGRDVAIEFFKKYAEKYYPGAQIKDPKGELPLEETDTKAPSLLALAQPNKLVDSHGKPL